MKMTGDDKDTCSGAYLLIVITSPSIPHICKYLFICIYKTHVAVLILNGYCISFKLCCVTPISMLPAHLGITRSSRTWNSSFVRSVLFVIATPLLKYSKALKFTFTSSIIQYQDNSFSVVCVRLVRAGA